MIITAILLRVILMTFAVKKHKNNNSITRQNDFQNRQKMSKKSKKDFLNGAAFKAFKALKLSEGPPRRLI